MKKFLLAVPIIIFTTGVYAQSDPANQKWNQSDKNYLDPENQDHPDGFMFQNGKMSMVKNGEITRVEKEATLTNGTVIMDNGNYMTRGGSKMIFREGEHMDMSGNMTPIKTFTSHEYPDNSKYSDGYLFQNGKMVKIKNGETTALNEDITLANGMVIMKNGNYLKKNGSEIKFREGEHMNMSGKTSYAENINEHENRNKQNDMYLLPDTNNNRNKSIRK